MGGVNVYRLFNKETDVVKTLSVDLVSMTYVSRVSKGDKNLTQQLVFVGNMNSYLKKPTAKSGNIISSKVKF
tara:strand:- start:194 stop:409 length:216 start_codon:yes stop_codon:yes gene_type:complete